MPRNIMTLRYGAFAPFIAVLIGLVLMTMTSCGGGGGIIEEPAPNPQSTNGLEPYGNKMLRLEVDWPEDMNFAKGEVRHVTARVYAKTARPSSTPGQVVYVEEELTLLGFTTWRCTIGSRAADHQSAGPQAGWEIDWREEFAGRGLDVTVVVEVDPEGLADHIASRFTTNGGTVQRREGRGRRGILGGLFGGLLIAVIQGALVVDPSDHQTKSASFVATTGPNPTPQTPVLTKADLQPPTATVIVGNTVQLKGVCLDQFGNEVSGASHTFTSSQSGIATVDHHGMVRGVTVGTTTIAFRCTKGTVTVTDTSVITVINPTVVFTPPVAMITASPQTGTAPLAVNFSAAGSYDPDGGNIQRYEWDFDGNGTYDKNTSTASSTTHTYQQAGTYTVVVRVTDDELAQDTASTQVVVSAGEPEDPFAGLAAIEIRPDSQSAMTLDASIGEITVFNVVGFRSNGSEFLWPTGTSFDWSLKGNTHHTALDENADVCTVYSTFAETGELKVVVSNGSHQRSDTLAVTVVTN